MNDQNNPQEENETLDFNRPAFSFTPQGTHMYRQSGPYLICRSCELQHAIWVGMDRLMVGIAEDGQPIIKTRKELGM